MAGNAKVRWGMGECGGKWVDRGGRVRSGIIKWERGTWWVMGGYGGGKEWKG